MTRLTAVGIDIGGTWVRGAFYREGGRGIRHVRLRKERGQGPLQAAAAVFRKFRIKKSRRLTLGTRGVWTPGEKEALRRKLKAYALEIRVHSDIELAHHAAFFGGPGVVVIAGTGSAAYAVDDRGARARAGGLGPLFGDEGSAFWLGREWLRKTPAAARRLSTEKDAVGFIAAAARGALARAKRGDRFARALREHAADALARLAREAVKGLKFPGGAPLSWRGGMFADAALRERFLKRSEGRFIPVSPLIEPEIYAAVSPGMLE